LDISDDHYPATSPFGKTPHAHRIPGPEELDPKSGLVAATYLDDANPWRACRTQ
jgi:hypothetical protein